MGTRGARPSCRRPDLRARRGWIRCFLLATLITALLLVLLELPKIPLLNAIDPDRWVDRFTSEDGDTPPDPYEAE